MPKKSVPAADAPAARSVAASPIVSSAHLVSPQSAELSEFEFGLIVAGNAFHRWITHCMSAAGLKDLTPLDVLVLHHVCLLYTSPSPRDRTRSRMPSSA